MRCIQYVSSLIFIALTVDANKRLILVILQFRYWGTDPKKGYAGTAILSKIEPISVVFGIPPASSSVPATEIETKDEEEEKKEVEAEKEWTQTESAGREPSFQPQFQAGIVLRIHCIARNRHS